MLRDIFLLRLNTLEYDCSIPTHIYLYVCVYIYGMHLNGPGISSPQYE